MVYKFFHKKLLGVVLKMKIVLIKNQQKNCTNILLENLIQEKYTHLIDNIWSADLADMQLISKFNEGFRFLLCVIDICSIYAWVIPLIDKKGIKISNSFQKVVNFTIDQ